MNEQAFSKDVGFYIFKLPLLEEFRDLFMVLVVLAAAMAIDALVVWVVIGRLDLGLRCQSVFDEVDPRLARHPRPRT